METTIDTKSTITLFDRANSQLQNTIFQHSHHVSAFLSEMKKSLHAMLVKICASRNDPLSLSPLLKCTTTASLCSHPLLGLQKCSASVNECQWVQFFSAWRKSMTCFCFIYASMSDANFSVCPSAASCHMATICNGISVGRFNLCCCITNICLWCYGTT